jgi:hypothetical protein
MLTLVLAVVLRISLLLRQAVENGKIRHSHWEICKRGVVRLSYEDRIKLWEVAHTALVASPRGVAPLSASPLSLDWDGIDGTVDE